MQFLTVALVGLTAFSGTLKVDAKAIPGDIALSNPRSSPPNDETLTVKQQERRGAIVNIPRAEPGAAEPPTELNTGTTRVQPVTAPEVDTPVEHGAAPEGAAKPGSIKPVAQARPHNLIACALRKRGLKWIRGCEGDETHLHLPSSAEIRSNLAIPLDGQFFWSEGTGWQTRKIAGEHLEKEHPQIKPDGPHVLPEMWKDVSFPEKYQNVPGFWEKTSTILAEDVSKVKAKTGKTPTVHVGLDGPAEKGTDWNKDTIWHNNEFPNLHDVNLNRLNPKTGSEVSLPLAGEPGAPAPAAKKDHDN